MVILYKWLEFVKAAKAIGANSSINGFVNRVYIDNRFISYDIKERRVYYTKIGSNFSTRSTLWLNNDKQEWMKFLLYGEGK